MHPLHDSLPQLQSPVRHKARPAARRSCGRLARLACVLAFTGTAIAPAFAQGGSESGSIDNGSTSGASAGSSTANSNTPWWTPGGGRTTLGLNLGRSDFQVPCGNVFACDDTDRYWSIYGRNMASDYWGSEVAFVDMGRMERGGGTTRARGLNVSLVGKVPLAQTFGVFGKVGALYGRTRTSTAAGADIAGGNDNGFGLSLGAGVSWDFSPKMSAVLEWDRYDFHFQSGRDAVNAASLGLQYKF